MPLLQTSLMNQEIIVRHLNMACRYVNTSSATKSWLLRE